MIADISLNDYTGIVILDAIAKILPHCFAILSIGENGQNRHSYSGKQDQIRV